MTATYKLIATFSFALLPILLRANVTGADPKLTSAPGDGSGACTQCHAGTKLNGGGGSIAIVMPGDATYTPGVKQHIQVRVSDPAQRRWGFELSARVASDPANAQAGNIASTDGNTQVECSNGRLAPCSSSSPLQFITHTLAGTRLGTTNSATFEFDWTPPSTDVGKVTLYAAGNAANGNSQDTGDHIYTTSVDLTPAAVAATPSVSSVQNAASPLAGVTQSSWITIAGANLSTTTRVMPAEQDKVSVSIDGKPSFVQYISPTQINALAPSGDALGPVEVRVTSNGQTSNLATANLQSFAPALFTFDGKYVATITGDNGLLDKSGNFFSAPTLPTPVKAGDQIVLYGTGFGTADAAQVGITIGGAPATVSSAGLAPDLPQIYQLNVQIPAGLADGDQEVVVQAGGVNSPSCFITIQNGEPL